MRPRGDQRYEQLRAQWQAAHPPASDPPPPQLQPADVGTWDDAPCPTAPGSWRYLSPPGDDGAMAEAWSSRGQRVQQVVDYEHTLAAIRAYCDFCPPAYKRACVLLRREEERTGPTPAAGVYGGVLYLDNGSALSRERLEDRARRQRSNERSAEAKRRSRAALAAGGDEDTAA